MECEFFIIAFGWGDFFFGTVHPDTFFSGSGRRQTSSSKKTSLVGLAMG